MNHENSDCVDVGPFLEENSIDWKKPREKPVVVTKAVEIDHISKTQTLEKIPSSKLDDAPSESLKAPISEKTSTQIEQKDQDEVVQASQLNEYAQIDPIELTNEEDSIKMTKDFVNQEFNVRTDSQLKGQRGSQ